MEILLAFLERIGASISKRPLLWVTLALFILLMGLFALTLHDRQSAGKQTAVIAEQGQAIKSLTTDNHKKDQTGAITNSVSADAVQHSDAVQQHGTVTKQQRDRAINKAYQDFAKSNQTPADQQRKDQAIAQAHIDAIWSNFCTTGTQHPDCTASAAQ